MRNGLNKAERITHSSGNVFLDIGFPPEKAAAMKLKARIISAIQHEIRRRRIRQAKLVEILDEHQPVVSNLMRGRISQMSIEKLLGYADRLGIGFEVRETRRRSTPAA